MPEHAAYLHITTNNTIYGTQFHSVPAAEVPLVADVSSDLFALPRDYSKFSLYFAAAQKNIGIPGVGVAVFRKDLLGDDNSIPPFFSLKAQARDNSVVNTANTFGIFVTLLMLRWTKAQGLEHIWHQNRLKAAKLYEALDKSPAFTPYVSKIEDRSIANICFTANTEDYADLLTKICADHDVTGVEGHRSTGGFRISNYNAVPLSSIQLVSELIRSIK